MPEMTVTVRWPDGAVQECYSPSLVMHDHLAAGERYPVDDFVARARAALIEASERVRAKYGFACTSALSTLADIEDRAAVFAAAYPTTDSGGQGRAEPDASMVQVLAMSPELPSGERPVAQLPTPAPIPAEPEHLEVVVIGGGQAGLSISWHLAQTGVRHVVLERATVGHEWRDGRWDNFTLVTPNWHCRLPGYDYGAGDPDGFMRRDDVHDFVRTYATTFEVPLREQVEVTSLSALAGGGFDLLTTDGPMTADQVVIATGGYHEPIVPRVAERLPDSVFQLHSSVYKNAAALPDGAVLVVGTGQSGAQIAEDLMLEGRTVHLAVGSAPRVARFYRGKDCMTWLDEMGHYRKPVEDHPEGLAQRDKTNHYVTGRDGGRDIDLRDFATRGVHLYGRLESIDGAEVTFAPTLRASLDHADAVMEGIKDFIDAYIDRDGIDAPAEDRYVPVWEPDTEPAALDLAAAGITSVIWSIGYRADYRWISLPTFDGSGHPRHRRGVTPVPGLYFLGLPWLHTWGSGRFAGIARDAAYLATAIRSQALADEQSVRRSA